MRTHFRSTRLYVRSIRILALAFAVVLGPALAGCDAFTDGNPVDASVSTPRLGSAPGAQWAGPDTPALAEVAVMSQNLYLGGDLFQLLAPECTSTGDNPLALLVCVDRLYGQAVASDFPARVDGIADEIARVRPALIGLQEVTTFYVQIPGDNLPGAPNTPATEVAVDFLALLLEALADRGLDYTAVSISTNADVELPAFNGQIVYDVRYQDADVVLALDDPDVETGAATDHTFETLAVFPIGGINVSFGRGYQTVEATVDGFAFTFVNAHLETGGIAGLVQEAQATELVTALDAIDGPVVLTGDLNSPADGSDTESYAIVTESLMDVFDRPNLMAEPTCCQASDLMNATSELDKRIDFVLYRGFDQARKAETVLDEPGDRVESDGRLLWPSDHAGVAALLIYNLRRARPNA